MGGGAEIRHGAQGGSGVETREGYGHEMEYPNFWGGGGGGGGVGEVAIQIMRPCSIPEFEYQETIQPKNNHSSKAFIMLGHHSPFQPVCRILPQHVRRWLACDKGLSLFEVKG